MIFALELSDNVDPTALATVALAILTLAELAEAFSELGEAATALGESMASGAD